MKTNRQLPGQPVYAAVLIVGCMLALGAGMVGRAQVITGQAIDESGAPQYRVDPFWPKPLPNRWSMQQVTGISVDSQDNVWFLNRPSAPEPDELDGGADKQMRLCCVRGPELIALDQMGNVVQSWGGRDHPKWPTNSQTVIADSKGNIWISGTAAQDSIIKYSRDGKVLWDFEHRPPTPEAAKAPENNQETGFLINKGRFQLDETANELYIIQQKRVLIYDASTGAYKRGWGGHGMPLSEISNQPIPGYTWTGGPPPDEKNFVPDLHFVEISRDRRVYIGERGANRIQVFTTEGKWLQDIMVSPNTPSRGCGGVMKEAGPCGTTYKLAISRDPQQKYLFVADGHNFVIWMIERQSGKTLGWFGGNGRLAGQLHFPNAVATDSRGNVYTGEVDTGKRIQKFTPVMAARK